MGSGVSCKPHETTSSKDALLVDSSQNIATPGIGKKILKSVEERGNCLYCWSTTISVSNWLGGLIFLDQDALQNVYELVQIIIYYDAEFDV
jgi:hypothetical protein